MTDQREAELLQRIAARDEALAAARQEIKLLRSKLDALARRLFGRSSEQLNEAQMQLLLQEIDAPGPALGNGSSPEAIETEPSRPKKVSRKSRGPRVPEHLPVIEETIVPEVVKTRPERGGALVKKSANSWITNRHDSSGGGSCVPSMCGVRRSTRCR